VIAILTVIVGAITIALFTNRTVSEYCAAGNLVCKLTTPVPTQKTLEQSVATPIEQQNYRCGQHGIHVFREHHEWFANVL